MVNIVTRMRKLRSLLWIRCGPGALILPKEVSKISMEFNTKLYGGHRGARKFWREMLPRMKYRNPSVPMTIHRHTDADGPSLLHIYTKSTPTSTSPPSATQATAAPPSATPNPQSTLVPDTSTPTHTLNIKDAPESEILSMLIRAVGATPITPTPQEEAELLEVADAAVRSERDRVEVREKLLKVRREEELLRVARGEVDAAAVAN